MKIPISTVRSYAAIIALLASGAPLATRAATSFLDLNGTTAGFGGPSGTADCNTTATWTTDATGVAAPFLWTANAGNNFSIGGVPSDFNGGVITINMSDANSIGASPGAFTIVSTNATVTMSGTANSRFNHAFSLNVATGSTLIMTTTGNNNGWNFNSEACTLLGGGTINFMDAFAANDNSASGVTEDMTNGTVILNQSTTSNFGGTSAALGFVLKTGTLKFNAQSAMADAFQGFTTSASQFAISSNNPTIDNTSGSPGTIALGNGVYTFGGGFNFTGSSSLSFGNSTVNLTVSPKINVANNTLTIGGTVTDNGSGFGIIKAGAGTLALTGANNCAGATTVSAGQLVVNTSSTGNGAYTNADGGNLDVQVLRVGQQIPMSSLTLGTSAGNSILTLDVGALGNPTVAPITLGSGALNVNGAANQISFASISYITSYPVVIPLISYGTANGTISGLTLGSFPASSPAYQGYISNDTVNLVIDLVLTNGLISAAPPAPQTVTWNGLTNGVVIGNWDTNSATTNWTASGVPIGYYNLTTSGNGDPVVFDDTLQGATNVNLVSTLVPASITFNNSLSNYVFSGVGNISGSATMALNGTARVTLDNTGNNNFNGGLTINSGTLQIGNNDAHGSLGSGTITDNGALVLDRNDTLLSIGVITGSGSLTNIGTGTVTLNGVQTYSGPTVLAAGTLAVSAPNANASGIGGGSGLYIYSGATAQANEDNALFGITGTTPIYVFAGGTLTGLGTADTGSGTSSHIAGMLTLYGGTLAMNGSAQNQTTHGTWDLDGGVTVPGTNTTSTISALDVVPTEGGGTSFFVTNGTEASGIDLAVTGTLIGGSSAHDNGFNKYGPGLMMLDNNNPIVNNVNVYGGTLQLGQTNDASAWTQPIGQGTVTLNAGSILKLRSGKGLLVTNTIADDGTGIIWSAAGTNLLAGPNTYSGTTFVGATSFLILTNLGSLNSSASIIVSNGTLNISPANSAMSSSGALSLTNGAFNTGTNTASIGTVTSGGSTISLTVAQSTATPNITAGTLNLAGNTNVVSILAVPGEPFFPTNLPIIKYSSFANVSPLNALTNLGLILPASGSPVGYLTNDVNNGSIDLVIISDTLTPIYPITWSGSSNSVSVGNWDILITPDWVLTSTPATPYKYQDTSLVTFDDSAAGSTSVLLQTNVAPGGITFNNSSKNYSISGAFKISTGAPLIESGTASVTLAETGGDNFAAGIQQNAGTLILADTNATISGGITAGGTLTTLLQSNVTINGGITLNSGTLNAQYAGTENGNITINGGSVLLDQTGATTGNLNINSGTAQIGNNDARGVVPSTAVADGGTLIFDRNDTALSVSQVISGGGTLENNGPGTVTLSITETFTGPVIANGGILVMDAGNNASPNGISRASGLTINTNATVAVLVDNSLAGHGAGQGTLPITINAGGVLTGAAGADSGAGTSCHVPGTITFNGGMLANSGTSLNSANGSWDLDDGVATGGQPFMSLITALDVAPTEPSATSFNIIPGGTPNGIDLEVLGTIIHATSQPDTGIALSGGGTLDFDNNNTYTGPATVSGSTLQLGLPGDTNTLATPAGAVASTLTISSSGILKLAGGKGVTVGNVVGDDGSGTVLSVSGTNRLTGADTYTGPTVVTAGTLALAVGGTINSSAAITVSNATFDISAATNVMTSTGNLDLQGATYNAGTNVIAALGSLETTNATLSLAFNTNVPDITVSTLTTGGTTNVVKLTSIPAGLTLPVQVPLLKYTTADPNLINGQNVPATLGVSFSGTGYLTNDTANSSIDVVITSVVNSAPTNIVASLTGNQLTLTWPADHIGWRLLAQTNSLTTGLGTNWVMVSGSAATDSETFTVNPANGTVFYRLVYP